MRLAKLAAYAIASDPTADVRGLLDRDEIRNFLDKMLGREDRTSLYVVSVLDSVGWEGDASGEVEVIAAHLGLDLTQVKISVERFQQRYGVAPRGGSYRYISPKPLGAMLAAEA